MNESLLLIAVAVAALLLGLAVGFIIASAKGKSNTGILQERLNLQQLQLKEEEKVKSDLIKKQEQLQDDKEFFQNELTARNVAFENLQHRFEE